MNYYAQGGQAHGLKALAQELPKYGRYGDTIVAHINPEEAGILKALGGSGTINPHTGLPEFGFFSGITNAIRSIVQPVYNATLKNIPGVDNVLTSIDKGIGSLIPGGWGTLASIAGSAVGLPTWALTGLGALTGSGALKKDGRFNLQGALLGGAMAYGASQIGQGLAEAGGGVNPTASDVAGKLGVEGASVAPGSQAAMLAEQNAGFGMEGLRNIGSSAAPAIDAAKAAGTGFSYLPSGEMVPTQAVQLAPQSSYVGDLLSTAKNNLVAEGAGIKNLVGLGDTSASTAAANFTKPITTGGMTALTMGTLGTMQLEEQQKYLDQQLAAGNISQAEYNAEAARIAEAKARAERAVRENPYQFASGGSVSNSPGMDSSDGIFPANLQPPSFMDGGNTMAYVNGGNVSTFSKGGDAKEKRDFLDMLEADFKSPPAQYVEGLGFVTPPPSVEGRLGANFDALGGNIRAGASGMAMMTPDKRIMATPTMMDIGYRGRVGPGDLDVGLQRAIRSVPGRGKDYALNATYTMPFAEGGQARFLSGGGDGMSDSIPATINGKQEARLADGEFVVPADVVSHLGNGSSKAGANRLYAMMDKVRSARTGTKKQAPAVNATKLMPA